MNKACITIIKKTEELSKPKVKIGEFIFAN